jgi:hypothetical protein
VCSHNAQTHGISGLCCDISCVLNGEPNPSEVFLARSSHVFTYGDRKLVSLVFTSLEQYYSWQLRQRERAAVLLQLLLS